VTIRTTTTMMAAPPRVRLRVAGSVPPLASPASLTAGMEGEGAGRPVTMEIRLITGGAKMTALAN